MRYFNEVKVTYTHIAKHNQGNEKRRKGRNVSDYLASTLKSPLNTYSPFILPVDLLLVYVTLI